jgi:hypothetical protein
MTLIPDLERQLTEAAARPRAPRRLARSAAAVAIALAIGAGVVALALDSSSDRERDRAPAGVLGLDIPAGTEPRLSDLFAVFAREPTPRDDSGWTKDELDDIPDRQPAEDPTNSRRVGPAGEKRYIWPMRDGVCSSFGNCLKLEVLVDLGGVSPGMRVSSGRDGRLLHLSVHGIAVDGIEEIRLTRPQGDDIVLPVEGNTFERNITDVLPRPTRWRWEDAGGTEHSLPMRVPGRLPEP